MSVLHDDSSDRMAAVEACHMSMERRRAARITRKVATQMVPWQVGRAATPFGVIIEDISETGVGIIHSEALEEGAKYLLTVPRAASKPVTIQCEVVRCERRGEHSFNIGLVAGEKIKDPEGTKRAMRLTSGRTRLLFMLFGVVGLLVAVLVPL